MVKIKNGDIPNALASLNALSREKLPVKGALKVRKLNRTLTTAWSLVDEVRKKLLDEHAAKDEAGNNLAGDPAPDGQATTKLADDKKQAFYAAWQELLGEEVEINDTLKPDDLGNREIEPALLIQLGDLLEE